MATSSSLTSLPPDPTPICSFPTSDTLFDCAWSESHDSLYAAASGDGFMRLFDAARLPPPQNPVRLLREHAREVHGLDWNPNAGRPNAGCPVRHQRRRPQRTVY
ncbi:unnamed protein product [Miscanthus lutarioriparius]|uniref:Uncharacterized protein n=1 Tax=Miscanthus lutarioriparius TaxID=422564 RepID=A0A811QMD5_9POAL|nr:unnamed protein product [Miscanthus lutarioriparius]